MKLSKKLSIPKNPGALARPYKDYRDIPLGSFLEPVQLPEEFDVFNEIGQIPVKDQNGSSSCVGMATTYYAETLNKHETKTYTRLSPRFVYSQICLPGGGAFLEEGIKIPVNRGIPENAVFNSPERGTEQQMRDKSGIELSFDNALTYKAKGYAFIEAHDIELVKQAIYQNKGVLSGVQGSNEGWQTAFVRPPKSGERIWGHALYYCGFKKINGKDYIKTINSWGEGWGEKGFGYIPAEYFTSGNTFSLLSLVDLPNNWRDLINMLKVIKVKNDNRIYAEIDGLYYWITSARMYEAGIGKVWGAWETIIEVDSIDSTKIIGTFNKEI